MRREGGGGDTCSDVGFTDCPIKPMMTSVQN